MGSLGNILKYIFPSPVSSTCIIFRASPKMINAIGNFFLIGLLCGVNEKERPPSEIGALGPRDQWELVIKMKIIFLSFIISTHKHRNNINRL